MARTLVFTATYNEVDNIENLIGEIFHYLPEADILIVDDASPDGTGALLDRLAAEDGRIRVLHRPSKLGLGSAHILAMKYALHQEYDYLITMDADFSHHPRYLPTLTGLLAENDFVIGSRYVAGGRCDYGFIRTLISRTANALARIILSIPTHEATTSFRGFSRSLLASMDIHSIWSDGYSFFMESLFVVSRATRRLGEFPIHFEDRRAGTSKISKREIFKAIFNLARLLKKRLLVLPFEKASDPVKHDVFDNECENCRSIYYTQMFPARGPRGDEASTYQCTSSGHRCHGRILRCLQCGLVYNETRQRSEEILNLYAEVEDEAYLKNTESRFLTFRHNYDRIRHYLPDAGKLLDVGSYCGISLKVAREMGFDPLGVEPSRWACNYSREVMQEPAVLGTLKDLPAEAGTFDVITLWDVFEHVPHPLKELERIHERLKPDGTLVLSTIFLDAWYPKILRARWPWYMDMHLYYFTLDSIRQLLKKTGFELVHWEDYTHIITFEYLLAKLTALRIPGAGWLHRRVRNTVPGRWMIPFRLGDVRMLVCRKVRERQPAPLSGPETTLAHNR